MHQQLLRDIQDLYQLNSVGGPLHIVLDDGNTDDESIQFCLDTCHDHWAVTQDPENAEQLILLVKHIASEVLQIPLDERERLYETRWGRRKKP